MAEFLRTIINRLREHAGNRRAEPRYAAHVEVGLNLSLSLGVAGTKRDAAGAPLRLKGHTHDMSESGLALIVPSIHIGGQYLTTHNRELEITLKLPTGSVQLHATPVRYSSLDSEGADTGHIIGVRITQMSEADRALYKAYLVQLRKK